MHAAKLRRAKAPGSLLTARTPQRVAVTLAPGTPVADRLFDWPRERLKPYAAALRLAGALYHFLQTEAASELERC